MARCPDCYAEFSIPRPIPKPGAKKPVAIPRADDGLDVTLKDSAIDPNRDQKRVKNQADEYLRRAEQDLEQVDSKTKFESYDFDTYSAFQKAFGFLGDPAVWILAAVPGFLLGLIFIGRLAISTKLAEQSIQLGFVSGLLVLVMLGLPLIAGCMANGLAILEASANKQKKVSQWPFYNLGEAAGEIIMLMVVLVFAAIPGGLVGWLLSALGIRGFTTILPLVSIWFLYPVMLLGVLDNGAVMQPYNADVVQSMKQRSDSWAAMYLWNAIATLLLFVILAWFIGSGNYLMIILGATAIPFLIYFMFRQIGNLAVGIADLTDLNFDDEDTDEPSDAKPLQDLTRPKVKSEIL